MKNVNLLIFKVLFAFVFLSGPVNAQIQDSGKSVKIYAGLSRDNREINAGNKFTPLISGAFQFVTSKKNYHEFGVSLARFDRESPLAVLNKTTSIGLRYEFGTSLFKKSNSPFVPMVGFAAMPYYSFENFEPVSSVVFPESRYNLGVLVSIVPRIQYWVSEKVFIDLNGSFGVFGQDYAVRKVEDPGRPDFMNKTGAISFNTFPGVVEFRLGAGIKI